MELFPGAKFKGRSWPKAPSSPKPRRWSATCTSAKACRFSPARQWSGRPTSARIPIVGNNALVRQSMVLNHCNVGFTTEVARSYVSDHCDMHACRVLDSVFAPDVNFSAGCTTANLRIDRGHVPSIVKGQKINSGRDKLGAIIGQGAFLSVDVMTMPGVKIGESGAGRAGDARPPGRERRYADLRQAGDRRRRRSTEVPSKVRVPKLKLKDRCSHFNFYCTQHSALRTGYYGRNQFETL